MRYYQYKRITSWFINCDDDIKDNRNVISLKDQTRICNNLDYTENLKQINKYEEERNLGIKASFSSEVCITAMVELLLSFWNAKREFSKCQMICITQYYNIFSLSLSFLHPVKIITVLITRFFLSFSFPRLSYLKSAVSWASSGWTVSGKVNFQTLNLQDFTL